ncbi:MAG: hypothetical protein WD775_08455 [Burkholderiales bacterium]
MGKPGNEYRISVRNRDGGEVLAVMSVDGVNVITGETAHPRQSGYVLGPRGRLEVKGWRKSLARTAAFYFTELGDSYAALGQSWRIGGIIRPCNPCGSPRRRRSSTRSSRSSRATRCASTGST